MKKRYFQFEWKINWAWYLVYDLDEERNCVTIIEHDRTRTPAAIYPEIERRDIGTIVETDDRDLIEVGPYPVTNPGYIFSWQKKD